MFGVGAARHRVGLRQLQANTTQVAGHQRQPARPDEGRVRQQAAFDRWPFAAQRLEQAEGVGPELVQGRLGAAGALGGAQGQPLDPQGGVFEMEPLLAQSQGGGGRQRGVPAGSGGVLPQRLPGVEQVLPDHAEGPVAFGELGQGSVGKVGRVTLVGQGLRAAAVETAAQLQPGDGVSEFILGDVGQGDVLFEDRRVAGPLGQAMRQQQLVVGQGGQSGEQGGLLVVRQLSHGTPPCGEGCGGWRAGPPRRSCSAACRSCPWPARTSSRCSPRPPGCSRTPLQR